MKGLETKMLQNFIIVHFVAPPHSEYGLITTNKDKGHLVEYLGSDALCRHQIWYNIRGGTIWLSFRTEADTHEQGVQKFCWDKSMPCSARPHTELCQEIRQEQGTFLLEWPILKHMAKPHEL